MTAEGESREILESTEMPPSRPAGKRSDGISTVLVALHVTATLAPAYAAAWLGPSFWLLAAWLALGSMMHGLLNLMHEAAHAHVFRGRRHSDWLGRWLLGPLVVSDFDAYRRRHWDHHRHLGTSRDTKYAYLTDLRGRGLLRFALKCLVLAEALTKFRHATGNSEKLLLSGEPARARVWLARAAVVQALFAASILGVAALAHSSWEAATASAVLAYGLVYVYGLGACTSFVAGLRAVAEHQIGPDGAPVVGRAALRNLRCNPVTRLVFGAYGFADHATHHADPGIPAYQLPNATREKSRIDPTLIPSRGYVSMLRTLARSRAPLRTTS